MPTSGMNTPDQNRNSRTSDASWYTLDNTGDTLLDTLPKNVSVAQDLSNAFEDVTIDLCGTADSKADLSTTFEDAKEVLSTVENEGGLSCTPAENRNQLTSDASWYILDETGVTQLDTLPKNVSAPRDLSSASEDVKTDLSSATNSESDLSTTFEDAEEDLPTLENKEVTVNGLEMFRGRILNVTSRLTPGSKGKSKKRKRKSATPLSVRKNTTPRRPGPGKGPNKSKKRKKSVILIDDSEPDDDSVIEIADESSVIVLSDDEVGVCSGSLTKPKAVIQNNVRKVNEKKLNDPLVVQDLTGNYIPKKGELPSKQVPPPEKIKKNVELYQPMADQSEKRTGLRPIIIDGCNVAFGHGRDRFSSLGLKICVDYFKKLGHEVRVFIPQFRKHHNATTDPQLLDEMEKAGTLCYTPSRRADGKMIVSYDDRFIVQYADANGGVIVSKDNYRDLLNENPEWKETINKRLLMYTWVGDTIMFPKDPLGRHGPNLEEFLKF